MDISSKFIWQVLIREGHLRDQYWDQYCIMSSLVT